MFQISDVVAAGNVGANKPVVSFDASRGEFVAAWHTVLPREEGAGGDLANEWLLCRR